MKLRSVLAVLVAAVLVLIVTGLAAGLRLTRLDAQSLWYDEAFSVYLARMSPDEIVARTAADIQPPLYYLVLHGWMQRFGDEEPALRGLSALFGVLAVPLAYGMAYRLFRSHLAAFLAGLLLAISPLHIWYGQETRMYTLLVFLSLLSSYCLLLLAGRSARLISRPDRPPALGIWGDVLLWVTYALAAAAALYTHYFALFVLAFQALYLLVVWWGQGFRPARLAWGALASGATVLLAYLPWLPHLVTRYGTDASFWSGRLKLHEVLLDIALSFVGGETLPDQPGFLLAGGVGLVALLCFFLLLGRSGTPGNAAESPTPGLGGSGGLPAGSGVPGAPRPAPYALPFLLFYLLLPPVFILLLSYNTPKFNARYVMMSQPALLLLLAGGLDLLWRRAVGAGERPVGLFASVIYATTAALALIFLAGVSGYADRNAYGDPSFARADFRAVARYVRRHIEPGETVILASGHMYPAFDYYAPNLERYLLPDSPTLDATRTLDYSVAIQLNQWLAGKGGVWVVLWQDEVVDPVGYLTALLESTGQEQPVDRTFPKIRLKHYHLPQGAHFPEDGRAAIAHPTYTNFGNRLRLLGYEQTGDNEVTLFWEALQPLDEDYRVSLVLRDTAAQAWGRWDGRPAAYLFPTTRWRPGQVVFGRIELPQVPGRPPGDYGLEVGVYTEANPSGLDVLDEAGKPQGKRAVLGAVALYGSVATADQVQVAHTKRIGLDGGLGLLGWDLNREEAQPGDRVLLTVGWDVTARPQGDYRVRVLLTDATGQTLDAGLYPPTNLWHPTGIWQAGQAWRGQITFRVPVQAQPGDAWIGLQIVDAAGADLGPPVSVAPIRVLPTTRVFTAPQPQVARPANLGDQITLLGADLPAGPVAPGGVLQLTLYWQAQTDMDIPYTVFVHLLAPGGQILAQDDREPAGATRPTSGWVPGEYVTDPHEITIPADVPPGQYIIEVGMYDAGARGLPRLAILGEEGQGTAEQVIFGPVSIQP